VSNKIPRYYKFRLFNTFAFVVILGFTVKSFLNIPFSQGIVSQIQAKTKTLNYPFNRILSAFKTQKETTLIVTGDVMLGRSVNTRTIKHNEANYPFLEIQSLLSSSDITLINLENPFFDPCPNTNEGLIFCAPTESVNSLAFAGVDVANIANNHIKNYGQKGYDTTITALNNLNISPSDSNHFVIIEKNKIKFGFLGFNILSQEHSTKEITSQIQTNKAKVDVLVVSFHWGAEYTHQPSKSQKELAHQAVKAGANLIVGHHPHVIQPQEIYQNTPILYSLGNLVFDQMWSPATREGVIAKFTFTDHKITSTEFTPVIIHDYSQPQIVTDQKTLEKINSYLSLK